MPKGFLIRRRHDLQPILTPDDFDLDLMDRGHGLGRCLEDEGCSEFDRWSDIRLGCSTLSSRSRLWLKRVDERDPSVASTPPSKPFSDPIIGRKIPPPSPSSLFCNPLASFSCSSPPNSPYYFSDVPCSSTSASLSYSPECFPSLSSTAFFSTTAASAFSSAFSPSSSVPFVSSPNCSYSQSSFSSSSSSSSSLAYYSTSSSTVSCSTSTLSSSVPSSHFHGPVASFNSQRSVTAIDAIRSTPSERNRFKIRRLLEPVPVLCWTELERTLKESQQQTSNNPIWISIDNEVRRHSRPKPHDPTGNKDREVEDSLRFLPYSPWSVPVPVHSVVKSDTTWKAGTSAAVEGSNAPGNRPKSVDSRGTLETIENRIGDFICQLCKSQFPDAFRLADHNCSCIRRIEYRCTECNKLFNCPANLASHRRWHKPNSRHIHAQGTKPPLRRDPVVRRHAGVAAGELEFVGATPAQLWPNEVC